MGALRVGERGLVRARTARAPFDGWFLALAAAFGAAGCASSPRAPERTAVECQRALASGEGEGVLRCVSLRGVSASEATSLVRRDGAEHRELARELEAGDYSVEWRAKYPGGEELVLTSDGGAYRIDSVFGLDAAGRTIEGTLARLERSLDALREADLFAMLVPERREELGALVELLREGLRSRDEARIIDQGERAIVKLTGGMELRLRRVDGRYLVEEIE